SRLRWNLVAALCAALGPGAAIASSVTIPDDFASIQAGIDSGADTVLVRDGDYEETPEAYRSLTLQGIGEGRPRVRGLLITNTIHVSRCWFRGGTGRALEIRGEVIDGAIEDNLLEGYATGIFSPDGQGPITVTSNVIRRMTVAGIEMYGDGYYTIESNEIEDCGSGIRCRGEQMEVVDN